MLEPFIGEIEILPFNFAPQGWAPCNGQLLPIAQNTALFSILGTTYGGDGKTTFALPDLQGRVPLGVGTGPGLSSYEPGMTGGAYAVTLQVQELPAHTHGLIASSAPAEATTPGGNFLAAKGTALYADPNNLTAMAPGAIAPAGGSLPHNNLQPYLVLNYFIALQGNYPARG